MSNSLWTARELTEATGGTFSGLSDQAALSILDVQFDSRLVKKGDLFIALKGARDGHDFVAGAFAAGAIACVTQHPIEGGPCLLVPDGQSALEALGRYARDRAQGALRGCVTGSVGKTSVTQMVMAGLRAGLSSPDKAHGAIKSFNNHIGVPLTMARMPRDCEAAVFELGMNHQGEISALSQLVKASVALITTVGAVHTENFSEGELGVARAKAEIFDGLEPESLAILNADNPWYNFLSEAATAKGHLVSAFGETGGADARLLDYRLDGDVAHCSVSIHGHKHALDLRVTGRHQALNALGALLMLEALEVDIETGLHALSQFAALDGRGKLLNVPVARGEITLIDESYNANPVSMRATIEHLGRMAIGKGQRKLCVLTDIGLNLALMKIFCTPSLTTFLRRKTSIRSIAPDRVCATFGTRLIRIVAGPMP